MTAPPALSTQQIDALDSVSKILQRDRWALIGATAIRCHLPMPRPTFDVDCAIAADSDTIHTRLSGAGWNRHPKNRQTWTRAGATIDVVTATDEDLLAGEVELEAGFVLSVIGFDLAFANTTPVSVGSDVTVPVPSLAVLSLLKMVAWLDRPSERAKDLADLLLIWDEALPADDDRRWDSQHPVCTSGLDSDDQSPFFVGWELGRIAQPAHIHWAKLFLDRMRDEDSIGFAQFVRAQGPIGDDDDRERRLRARMLAFERGLQAATARSTHSTKSPQAASTATAIKWGASGSFQLHIHDAIEQRRVLKFRYKGLLRVASPHVLGVKSGELQLLAWQTGGDSSSSSVLPAWRRFAVNEMTDIEFARDTFDGPKQTSRSHSRFDRHIAVVRWP